MIVSTTSNLENNKVLSYLGVVHATHCIYPKFNINEVFCESDKDIDNSVGIVIGKLEEQAEEMGANGIVDVKTERRIIGEFNKDYLFMVTASGTAVKLKFSENEQN